MRLSGAAIVVVCAALVAVAETDTKSAGGRETIPADSRQCEVGPDWVNGNNNDEVVLSDDPNFIPASVFNGNWSALQHVQPVP